MPKILTRDQFIQRSLEKHGDLYDYSKSTYINNKTKIEICCQKHKICFWQTPKHHLNGKIGCRFCSKYKRENTNLKKYNVKNIAQLKSIQEKVKRTNMEKYGVEHALQLDKFRKKQQATNLNKYGTEYTFNSNKIRNKIKQTNLDRYGVKNATQKHILPDSLSKLNDKKWLVNQHHDEAKTLARIGMEIGVSDVTVGNYFHDHNIEIRYFFQSAAELELGEYIKSLGYDISTSNFDIIPPFEVDIFIPSLNIALEYNGLYWHKNKGMVYHKNKTDLCKLMNIHLIHIWEDQWLDHNKKLKYDINNIIENKPLQELSNQVVIDASFENLDTYLNLGYNISSIIEPCIYSPNIWDCGKYILINNNIKNKK